jgi:hypothetical protein
MKRLLKKLIGRRARRFYLGSAVLGVSLIVLGYQIARWRGASAWKAAEERLETEGERKTLSDLVPAEVPDGDNFFGTSLLKDIAFSDEKAPGSDRTREQLAEVFTFGFERGRPDRGKIGSRYGSSRNLRPWLDYISQDQVDDGARESLGDANAAEEILQMMDTFHADVIDELVTASKRSQSQITPGLDERAKNLPMFELQVPHFSTLSSLAKGFGLRATAAAQCKDSARWYESVVVLMKIAEACHKEPLLVGLLVGNNVQRDAMDALWEGINAKAYTAEQLLQLQSILSGSNLQTNYLTALRTETIAALDIIDHIEGNRAGMFMIISGFGDTAPRPWVESIVTRMVPSGWLDQNRATYVNWALDYSILPARDEDPFTMIARSEELERLIMQQRPKLFTAVPHQLVAMIAMPVNTSIVRRVMFGEAERRMALTACALERHFLESGRYPTELGDLVSDFLEVVPPDPCQKNHELLYRIEGDPYRLWSVALDQKHDNGSIGELRPAEDDYDGDWIWRF